MYVFSALGSTGSSLNISLWAQYSHMANTILTCMERAATKGMEYNRYGSDTLKKCMFMAG